MTSIDRFDPFEQRITAAIDEIAAPRRPPYVDDILRQTARTKQRPRWSFPGRWLPMDTTMAPAARLGRIPARPLLLLLLALLVAALAGITVVGSLNRSAPPFGLAGNGQLAYPGEGHLWLVTDPDGSPAQVPVDGQVYSGVMWSPDGRTLAYAVTTPGAGDRFWVVGADGSNPRPVEHPVVADGFASAAWSPDSRSIAISGVLDGQQQVVVVDTATGRIDTVDTGPLKAWDVSYNPRDPRQLLLKLQDLGPRAMDLYVAGLSGQPLRSLGVRTTIGGFGEQYTLSGASWSPGADVIAYNSTETDPATSYTHFRVRLVNADGTGDRALPGPADPRIHEGWPTWSPDGKWLLVHRWVWRETGDRGDGWLAIAPGDGSTPAHDIGPRLTEGDDTDIVKAWSPDGTKVLMETGGKHVYLVDPFADTWEELPYTQLLPDWQRAPR